MGDRVGFELVGEAVGDRVGSDIVGEVVGDQVGSELVGEAVGGWVGFELVGETVGDRVGSELVGEVVGSEVIGAVDGPEVVGSEVVGADDGTGVVGAAVGGVGQACELLRSCESEATVYPESVGGATSPATSVPHDTRLPLLRRAVKVATFAQTTGPYPEPLGHPDPPASGSPHDIRVPLAVRAAKAPLVAQTSGPYPEPRFTGRLRQSEPALGKPADISRIRVGFPHDTRVPSAIRRAAKALRVAHTAGPYPEPLGAP